MKFYYTFFMMAISSVSPIFAKSAPEASEIKQLLVPIKEENGKVIEVTSQRTLLPSLDFISEKIQRLDSVIGFNSDGSFGTLQQFSYDDNGWWNETNYHYWSPETNSWEEPFQSIIIDRMENGYVLSESNLFYGAGIRTEYEYDNKNRGIKQTNYYKNSENEPWIPTDKGEYIYDDNDNIIEETIFYYDTEQKNWVNMNHNFATWDNKGRQTSIESYYWNGNDWAKSIKIDYEWFNGPYDPDYIEGMEKERLTYRGEYMIIDDNWVLVYITENEFNDEGRIISQSFKYYNREYDNFYGGDSFDGLVYLNTAWKSRIGYDERGLQNENRTFAYIPGPTEQLYELGYVTYEEETLDNGDFIQLTTNQNIIYDESMEPVELQIIDKTWYAYNSSLLKLWCYEEMPSYYDETFYPVLEDKWEYDDNNNLIEQISYDFQDGARVPNFWTTITYDNENNVIEIIGRGNANNGFRPFKESRNELSISPRDYKITEEDFNENWIYTNRWNYTWDKEIQIEKRGYLWDGNNWANNQGQNNYFDFSVKSNQLMIPEAYTDEYKIDYIEELYGYNDSWITTKYAYYYSDLGPSSVSKINTDPCIYFSQNTLFVKDEISDIFIMDIDGRIVAHTRDTELNLDFLSKGLYIATAIMKNGNSTSLKINVR